MLTVVGLRFTAHSYTVMESNDSVSVVLEKVGASDVNVEVLITTMAGTAEGELLQC